MRRKLDKAMPITENQTNKRVVIVCRKASWHVRRYRVVGRLASDPLIKDLVRTKGDYRVFEYFEHINNPAKVKTDIIKDYKKKALLMKSTIKDGELTINVVRLNKVAYAQFINELKDTDSKYEVVGSDSGDEDDSLCTALE